MTPLQEDLHVLTDLVSKHAVELLLADRKPLSVGAVHDQDDVVSAGVVHAPSLP